MAKKKLKRKRRKGRGKPKGNGYEREIAKLLSVWWAGREDVFWRTDSGARAKARGRRGLRTFGQSGDIVLTDPIGEPLLDVLCIEIKRGYNADTVANLLDQPPRRRGQGPNGFEKFLLQTIESWEQSGSFAWLLIQRRDKRQPIVFMPASLVEQLKWAGCFKKPVRPWATFCVKLNGKPLRFSSTTLEEWLRIVTPQHIRRISARV